MSKVTKALWRRRLTVYLSSVQSADASHTLSQIYLGAWPTPIAEGPMAADPKAPQACVGGNALSRRYPWIRRGPSVHAVGMLRKKKMAGCARSRLAGARGVARAARRAGTRCAADGSRRHCLRRTPCGAGRQRRASASPRERLSTAQDVRTSVNVYTHFCMPDCTRVYT